MSKITIDRATLERIRAGLGQHRDDCASNKCPFDATDWTEDDERWSQDHLPLPCDCGRDETEALLRSALEQPEQPAAEPVESTDLIAAASPDRVQRLLDHIQMLDTIASDRQELCDRQARMLGERDADIERLREALRGTQAELTAVQDLATRKPLPDEVVERMWVNEWDGFISFEEALVIIRATERAHGIEE